jgi:hypothetical protein
MWRPRYPARLIIGLVETGIEKIRVAEALAELAIAARLVAREMRQLVKQGRVVGFGRRARRGADKGLARRKLNAVGRGTVEGENEMEKVWNHYAAAARSPKKRSGQKA